MTQAYSPPEYPGHSANIGGKIEPLGEHIALVSRRACEYGAALGVEEQAKAMGLLHDLGKYSERFKRRVTDASHPPAGDHSLVGALVALRRYKQLGCLPATAIAGHHGGLGTLISDWRDWDITLAKPIINDPSSVTERDPNLLLKRFYADGFTLPPVADGLRPGDSDADDMLDTRMLFSTLVDADFVETEAHFEGDADTHRRYRPEGPVLNPGRAIHSVAQHVHALATQPGGNAAIGAMRRELYASCLDAAQQRPGLFTLAAPTGSGKTLSMLAFALAHAKRYGLRRVVLVMPFLNIIDQTARLYRTLFPVCNDFPEHYVLEDHSLAAPAEDEQEQEDADSERHRTRRLLSQNWDAPIVLTTNIRCLESLMSNRTSDCRKLHRLAKTVLLFDEVQTLPRELATATLATLGRLSNRYGATVLFATATQPAFDDLDAAVRRIGSTGWSPQAVLGTSKQTAMFDASARRTCVHWEHQAPWSLEAVADRLAGDPSDQLMCIVNLKRHARRLGELLLERNIEGVSHLSTSMCPAHRRRVLDKILACLTSERPQPLRLISTQCIEAGVDIDFPVVYRALAPLEAIAQAAGRCNRHGVRPQPGRVHVIKPLDDNGKPCYPPGYTHAVATTEAFVNAALNTGRPPESLLHDPAQLHAYYRQLYLFTGTGEGALEVERKLAAAMEKTDFREVAKLYRLIKADTINVLVPYDRELFDRLLGRIRSDEDRRPGFLRQWIAEARPITVSVFKRNKDKPLGTHLEPIFFNRRPSAGDEPDWYAALADLEYHPLYGLQDPGWETVL